MKKENRSAFTLIELSIVMIIIALLIIGIVGGAKLVTHAKMTRLISETSDYVKEFNVFYDKYNAYPGDFERATNMFGTTDINSNTIRNGDGDDYVGSDDYTDPESAGFFHHLYISGILNEPKFNGVVPSDISEVEIGNTNFPGTPFGDDTFMYPVSNDVGGRYVRCNRIAISSLNESNENFMTPDDAETLDIKMDNGDPYTGTMVSANASLSNGLTNDDNGCTSVKGYDIDSTDVGCQPEILLDGSDIKLSDAAIAAGVGSGVGNDSVGDTDCIVPPVSNYTGLASWTGYTVSDVVATTTQVPGVCDTGYGSSGTPTITCTAGSWSSMSDPCEVTTNCTVPLEGATGYENITAWVNAYDLSSLSFGESVTEGTTIEGICANGYAGTPQTTCTTAPTWDALTESCSAASCISGECDNAPPYYCGDDWDCSNGTCCNNTINNQSPGYIIGDCDTTCTRAIFGNDTISTAEYVLGDCYMNCSGGFGDDNISNITDYAFGDCNTSCSGVFGNDVINDVSGGQGNACGDCMSDCSGTMGNDTLIDIENYAWGDCGSSCSEITMWATDIFRYTGSNSTATISDFNGGGIDDKIQLPSGVTVSLSGSGYSRTLTYAGSYSGTIAIQCDSGEHDCDEGGSWAVNTCQIYVGGTSLSSDQTPCGGDCLSAGFDSGTCSFN